MKKIILIISIFLLISNFSKAQNNFTVVILNGEIKNKTSNKALHIGEEINKNMSFQFSQRNNYALLINKKNKERAILRKKPNDDIYFAKSNFTTAMSNMSSRSGLCFKNSVDFATYFADTIAIINNTEIIFDTEKYPIDSTHFFFISYIDKNNKAVLKKLKSKNDTLFINYNDFNYTNKTNNIDSKILYRKNDTSYFLSKMNVNIINSENLKETYKVLKGMYNKDELPQELNNIICFQYGKCQEEDILNFIEENK